MAKDYGLYDDYQMDDVDDEDGYNEGGGRYDDQDFLWLINILIFLFVINQKIYLLILNKELII